MTFLALRIAAGCAVAAIAVMLAVEAAGASGNCLLYTNGDPNGVIAYDNGVEGVYGGRRTLLDDFVVPFGETWIVDGLHHLHTWNTLPPGAGTGMEIALRVDDDGAPGAPLQAVNVTDYMEMATGRVFFNRDEAQSWTTFDAVVLAAGHYWFEAAVVGPEPNLWLTAPLQNEGCWVNYADDGGLESGFQHFGVTFDLSWCLSGDVIFDPAGACCLADGTCLEDVPAGACRDGLLGIFALGQTCDDVTCLPYGACCLLDGSCMSFEAENDCVAADGDFRAGEHCSLVTCPVRGACRFHNGQCDEVAQAGCPGDYRGDGVRCEDVQCPPAGACCLPDGTCSFVLETLCTDAGGDYQGDDVGCGATECPTGACCHGDGTCDVRTEGSCERDKAIWRGEDTDCADFNGNGIPDTCEDVGSCRSDTNDDGVVDFLDVVTLLTDWGSCAEGAGAGAGNSAAPRSPGSPGTCTLHDNGEPDGVNGYSNAAPGIFSFRRSLLDDFEVPLGETWVIDGLRHRHLWNTRAPGSGIGMRVALRQDDNGIPGLHDVDFAVTGYLETATGRVLFDREEAESWTTFLPVVVGPGRYWFDANIMGPEDNFWLTAEQQLEECWVDYGDLCGLCSGTDQFGLPSDLNWCLSGQIIFDSVGACCLPDGSCVDQTPTSTCEFELFGIFHEGLACAQVECVAFGACCLLDGACGESTTEADCAAQEGVYHEAERCADVECPVRGACCFPNTSCEELSEADCVAAGADYQGDGHPCDGTKCPESGACCLPDGACSFITAFACAAAGGDYRGDGVGCGITECPTGACCRADGTCAVLTEDACDGQGGIWRGEDTDCSDFNGNGIADTCETIGTCRSDSNGDGEVNFVDLVTLLADWGPCEG